MTELSIWLIVIFLVHIQKLCMEPDPVMWSVVKVLNSYKICSFKKTAIFVAYNILVYILFSYSANNIHKLILLEMGQPFPSFSG